MRQINLIAPPPSPSSGAKTRRHRHSLCAAATITMQAPTARTVIFNPLRPSPQAIAFNENPRLKISNAAPTPPIARSIPRENFFRETSSAVKHPSAIASIPPRYEYSRHTGLWLNARDRASGPITASTNSKPVNSLPRPSHGTPPGRTDKTSPPPTATKKCPNCRKIIPPRLQQIHMKSKRRHQARPQPSSA